MEVKQNIEQLKNDIESYVKENGWPGFFGLLATITPTAVHQEDLEKYNANLIPSELVTPPQLKPYEPSYIIHDIASKKTPQRPQEASIYAAEHISAVQEDLLEHRQNTTGTEALSQPKTKILTNKSIPANASTPEDRSSAPNPWGDAKTVAPGEVRDILTR